MSDGYCEVDFTDTCDEADPVEFCHRETVVARKDHRCAECAGVIAVGERHGRVAYRFEGEFHADRICPSCQEAAGEFNYHLVGGSLWEMFHDEWDNGAHIQACISRLTTARAKEHMRQQWVKWHERRAAQRSAGKRWNEDVRPAR